LLWEHASPDRRVDAWGALRAQPCSTLPVLLGLSPAAIGRSQRAELVSKVHGRLVNMFRLRARRRLRALCALGLLVPAGGEPPSTAGDSDAGSDSDEADGASASDSDAAAAAAPRAVDVNVRGPWTHVEFGRRWR
jgi:hypothetical protein